jgi:hypothetical protein
VTLDEIRERLFSPEFHLCAVCLRVIDRGVIQAREGTGTRVSVRCHSRVMSAIVPDVVVEDRRRVFWFDDSEGEPHEDARAKRRRELQDELDRVRAARGETTDIDKEQP